MRLIFLTLLSVVLANAEGGILDVDWSKINKSQQKASVLYPSVLIEGTKNIKLPVYLSATYAYDKNMIVVADKDFYSISFVFNGLMVLFEGDRTYQESVSPSNKEFQKIVQKPASVEFLKSEEVMIAEFNRHGVNYAISVECNSPKRDKHCTQENFIRSLYNSLKMVGGQP